MRIRTPLTGLISYTTTPTPKTISDIRLACLVTSDQLPLLGREQLTGARSFFLSLALPSLLSWGGNNDVFQTRKIKFCAFRHVIVHTRPRSWGPLTSRSPGEVPRMERGQVASATAHHNPCFLPNNMDPFLMIPEGWEDVFDRYHRIFRGLLIPVHGPYEVTIVPVPVDFHIHGGHSIDNLDTSMRYFDHFPVGDQAMPHPFTVYWGDQQPDRQPRNRVVARLFGADFQGNVLVMKNAHRDVVINASKHDIPVVTRLLTQALRLRCVG